jgi:hypothetical protein
MSCFFSVLTRTAVALALTSLLPACADDGNNGGDGHKSPRPSSGAGGSGGDSSENGGSSPASTVPSDITAMDPPAIGDIGVLPQPLPVTAGKDSEKLASELAAVTLSWSSDALPAFEAALLHAGYTIKNVDEVLFKPDTSNGIAIQAWDVQAAKALADRGAATSLSDLSSVLNTAIDGLTLDVTGSIIDAVGAAKSSGVPSLVFWADLLTEFGRRADSPHDFATLAPDADVQLSPPELLLIFTRLRADLYAWVHSKTGNSPTSASAASPSPSSNIAQIAQASTNSGKECQQDSETQLILDYFAAGMGIGFGQLTKYTEKSWGLGEKAGTYTSYANLIGAYVKLFWSLAAFDADVHFDTNPQIVNCVRPLLNALGVDFSLPSDGPIQGARVEWELLAGGTRTSANPSWGFVQFVKEDPTTTMTDDAGKATIHIEGAPQRVMIKDDAKPVKRRAKVRAGFMIKPANLYQDFVDAAGPTIVPSPQGLLVTPAEMMYRTTVLFGKSWSFPVIDWSMGTLHWEEKGTLHESQDETLTAGRMTSTIIDVKYVDSRTYDVVAGSGYSLLGHLKGNIQLQPTELSLSEDVNYARHVKEQSHDGMVDCPTNALDTFELSLEGDGPLSLPLVFSIDGEGGSRYSMDVGLPGYSVSGMGKRASSNDDPCAMSYSFDRSSTESVSDYTRSDTVTLDGVYDGTFQGHRENHSTLEPIIHGSFASGPPRMDTTIVLDWNFSVPISRP